MVNRLRATRLWVQMTVSKCPSGKGSFVDAGFDESETVGAAQGRVENNVHAGDCKSLRQTLCGVAR